MNQALLGVDADDTLWHNETVFRLTHERFNELLSAYAEPADIEQKLNEVEQRNLATYGYGAKGFTLSMMETALELSGDRAPACVIREILEAGRDMMRHPVDPLPGVPDALAALAERRRLILITKGDLFHQESKLAGSGLGGYFSGVEIVSEKTPESYIRCFGRHGGRAEACMMAGNSVRSDIWPMLHAGGLAALIPYPLVWSHEAAETPDLSDRFRQFSHLSELCGWIDEIDGRS
jgi:putative hydrolase of the HAD superfamily